MIRLARGLMVVVLGCGACGGAKSSDSTSTAPSIPVSSSLAGFGGTLPVVPSSAAVAATLPVAASTTVAAEEVALRARVVEYIREYHAQLLQVPEPDRQRLRDYLVPGLDDESSAIGALNEFVAGGYKFESNVPPIDFTTVESVDLLSPTVARVRFCNSNNLISIESGPNRILGDTDDVRDGSIGGSRSTEIWATIDGTWRLSSVLNTEQLSGPCDSA